MGSSLTSINTVLSGLPVASPTQFNKTVTAAATPERLLATPTYAQKALIFPLKGVRTANTGNVYLGIGSADDTQPWMLTPSTTPITIEAPLGRKIDLSLFYLDVVTAGDGVVVWYW
jgi:hypothetical protein